MIDEETQKMQELITLLQQCDAKARWFYDNQKAYLLPTGELGGYISKMIDNLANHLGNIQVRELGIDRYANDKIVEKA